MLLFEPTLDGLTFFEPSYLLCDLKLFIINFLMLEIKLPSVGIKSLSIYGPLLYIGPFHFDLFYLELR